LTVERGMYPAVADSFSIYFKVRPAAEMVTIKTFEAYLITGNDGRRSYKKSDTQKTVTVPYYIDYYPTKSVRFPFAYLVAVKDPDIISLLKLHGIKLEILDQDMKLIVERFDITNLKGSSRLNQGHYTNTVEGDYLTDTISFPRGTIVIRTAQKLANIAACLLEPQSGDGLVTWNYFDRYLVPQWGTGYNQYPVFKIIESISLKTIPI